MGHYSWLCRGLWFPHVKQGTEKSELMKDTHKIWEEKIRDNIDICSILIYVAMFLFSFPLLQKGSLVKAEIADEVSDSIPLILEENNCSYTHET